MKNSKLYLILDAQVLDHASLLKAAKEAVDSGVDVLQIRDKHASDDEVIAVSRQIQDIVGDEALFIVNDNVRVAKTVNADGVHIGQEDTSLASARRLLGDEKIIGVSCQNTAQAIEAEQRGADYIGFGSVFKTLTKPERQPMNLDTLESVCSMISIPVFAIGGIDERNLPMLTSLGVKRVALTRAILKASDRRKAVSSLKSML